MALPQVIASIGNKQRDTVTLVFDDRASGEYSMRGGIAWPTLTSDAEHRSVIGCAVVCGLNIETDTVVIFEHVMFNSISPQIVDGTMRNLPFTPVLAGWISRYLCDRFYWSDRGETHSMFRRSLYQAEELRVKPSLISVEWDDDADASNVVWFAASGNRLKIQKDLFDKFKEGEVSKVNPAKHAIMCALIGYQRFPWSAPRE